MMIAAEWGAGQVFWVLLWLALFVVWVRLVFVVFILIVRANYLSGWAKALWTLGIIALPFVGILAFLVVNGGRRDPVGVGDYFAPPAPRPPYG